MATCLNIYIHMYIYILNTKGMVSVHQITVLAFRAPEASSAAFTFSPAMQAAAKWTLISRSRKLASVHQCGPLAGREEKPFREKKKFSLRSRTMKKNRVMKVFETGFEKENGTSLGLPV